MHSLKSISGINGVWEREIKREKRVLMDLKMLKCSYLCFPFLAVITHTLNVLLLARYKSSCWCSWFKYYLIISWFSSMNRYPRLTFHVFILICILSHFYMLGRSCLIFLITLFYLCFHKLFHKPWSSFISSLSFTVVSVVVILHSFLYFCLHLRIFFKFVS